METRILEDRDIRRYMALRAQAANEHPRHTTRDLERELFVFADNSSTVMSVYSRQGTVVWGVYDGIMLVGTIAISRRFDIQALTHLWLWGMYVRPRYRGTPASRLLMEAVLAWCQGEHASYRLLSCYETSNHRAAQFLFRWGFHPVVEVMSWRDTHEMSEGCILVERDRG